MNDARKYKNILIYRIGHLGDTLVSLPAFWAIRKAFPEARLTLLTNLDARNPNYIAAKSVLPESGLIDEWLFYPTNLPKAKTLQAFVKLFAEIRRENFDCLFYLMTRNRTENQIKRDVKFFKRAKIRKIFGTEYLRENLISEPFEKPLKTVESEIEFFLNCLPSDEFDFNLNSKPEMLLSKSEKEFSKNWLKKNCGKAFEQNRLAAIAPGSKWESKVWAEAGFAEVVSKLIQRENIFPVIFGGKEDREKGNRLLKIWGKGANAAGELNIRQAAAALEKCRIYLGNDTGTMHLAASVGTPCAGIFAAIDLIGRWHPFGENHIILRERIECEGCHTPVCPFNNECLTGISTEKVLAACEKLLKQKEK